MRWKYWRQYNELENRNDRFSLTFIYQAQPSVQAGRRKSAAPLNFTLGVMVSNLELFSMLFLAPVLFLVLVFVAKENRHKSPRLVLFFFSTIFLAIGLFCFIFTYQDFTQNQVSLIFLKHSAPFSKFDSPKTFIFGLVLNSVFALLLAGAGLFGMFKSITNINFRFKK